MELKSYLSNGLDGLMDGGVTERFNDALRRVAENIRDPNTEALKPRKITLTFTFKPEKNRVGVAVYADAKPTLVPRETVSTFMTFGYDGDGELVMTEIPQNVLPGQIDIDGNEAGRKITPLVGIKTGGNNS